MGVLLYTEFLGEAHRAGTQHLFCLWGKEKHSGQSCQLCGESGHRRPLVSLDVCLSSGSWDCCLTLKQLRPHYWGSSSSTVFSHLPSLRSSTSVHPWSCCHHAHTHTLRMGHSHVDSMFAQEQCGRIRLSLPHHQVAAPWECQSPVSAVRWPLVRSVEWRGAGNCRGVEKTASGDPS